MAHNDLGWRTAPHSGSRISHTDHGTYRIVYAPTGYVVSLNGVNLITDPRLPLPGTIEEAYRQAEQHHLAATAPPAPGADDPALRIATALRAALDDTMSVDLSGGEHRAVRTALLNVAMMLGIPARAMIQETDGASRVALRRFTAGLGEVRRLTANAHADMDASVPIADALTRLVAGLTAALNAADPMDPADQATLTDRPTYPARTEH